MADDLTIDAGIVATDDCSSKHVQLVKLAYSADGVRTHAPVDADGVLVNLGANNDVANTPTRPATATLANVAGATSSTTLQASNANRRALVIVNDSTATLYIKYGSSASTTSYTYRLGPGDVFREELYTGIVTGIWDAVNGNARMTELT